MGIWRERAGSKWAVLAAKIGGCALLLFAAIRGLTMLTEGVGISQMRGACGLLAITWVVMGGVLLMEERRLRARPAALLAIYCALGLGGVVVWGWEDWAWAPVVWAALGMGWSARSMEGIRGLAVFVVGSVASFLLCSLALAGSAFVIQCSRDSRWICELESVVFLILLGAAMRWVLMGVAGRIRMPERVAV